MGKSVQETWNRLNTEKDIKTVHLKKCIMRKIHIALAADSNYLVPITVVLQSIFDNNRGEDITIYLLYLEGTLKE